MKLYENKREITLKEALTILFINNVPNHNFEYMISFDDVTKVMAFGKSWTKKDILNWGKDVCKFWIHKENCPTLSYDDVDVFLMELFRDPYLTPHWWSEKRFHVWEEVK